MKLRLTLTLLALTALVRPSWTYQQTPAPAAPSAAPAQKPLGPDEVFEKDPNRVVATVNGQKIMAKDVIEMLKPFPPEQRRQIYPRLAEVIQQLYTQQQFADAATKMNLQTQSPWKEQIDLNRRSILARAYMAHLSETAAKDPSLDAKAYYDGHKSEFETAKFSAIFIGFNAPGTPAANGAANARTEEAARDKANDVVKKLKAGGDFAALARSDSEHPTASKGGDLGSYALSTLPEDFRAAVANLQPGQISDPPIKNGNYFMVVRLDSREVPPFETAKSGIDQKLQAERVKKETDKYAVHVEDQDFFNTSSGATPGAPAAPAAAPKTPTLQRPAPKN